MPGKPRRSGAGDFVDQRRLPAAEREAVGILVRPAGRLPDEIEGREQFEVDQAHVVLRCR